MVGKAAVRLIVAGEPGMLNAITSNPALLLASVMACAKDPALLLLVLVTVKVAVKAGKVEKLINKRIALFFTLEWSLSIA